jgi:hypothetical protein
LLVGFDIEPTIVGEAATWKGDDPCFFAVDNREFQVPVERRRIYLFPFHDRQYSHIKVINLCDPNH